MLVLLYKRDGVPTITRSDAGAVDVLGLDTALAFAGVGLGPPD